MNIGSDGAARVVAPAGAGWPAAASTTTRRRFFGRAAGIAAASPVLAAACGTGGSAGTTAEPAGGAQSAPPVEMEFLHFFDGTIADGFKVINERFEATNPGIKWQGLFTPYNEMHVKIVALVSAGTPPDGMSAPSTRSSELIMRKILREIDSYVAKDKGLPLADVYPARLDNYRLNNTLYALPVDNGTGAVYYNKELFDRAGVPYPKDDWTWDDLHDKARRLTRKDGPDGAVYGFQYPTSLHNFYALFAGQGGEYFDKNLTKVAFDTGGSVKALQWFLDLRCKEGLAPTPEQVTELRTAGGSGQIFGHGRYAMEYGWYGVIRDLHTPQSKIGDNWDVAPIPQPANGGKRYNVVGGQGFAVINGARHPDAAYAYARFLISDEGHKLLRGTWNPSRRSMAKLGQPDDGIPKNFVAAFADMVFKHGFSPWWYVPGYTEWEQAINQELAPCWRCERTADTAARTLAPVVNDMIKQRPTSF